MTQNNSGSNMALGFLIGAILGGSIALLCAPSAGKDTRSNLKKKYDELMQKMKEKREKIAEKA